MTNLLLTIISSIILALGGNGTPHEVYGRLTVVTNIDYENDLVYCQDFEGEVWCFSEVSDWNCGDYCVLTLDNNCTQIIYDDIIVNTTYCGWLDGTFGYGECAVEYH